MSQCSINFIEKFLARFNSAFSTKHQRSIFREFIYAMFSAIANNTVLNYQKLQYFFSESNWDTKKLNDIRLKILQGQRTTMANKSGVLTIDDTARPKNRGRESTTLPICALRKCTDGMHRWYSRGNLSDEKYFKKYFMRLLR